MSGAKPTSPRVRLVSGVRRLLAIATESLDAGDVETAFEACVAAANRLKAARDREIGKGDGA